MTCLRGHGKAAVLIVAMLMLGSYNTLNMKLQFQTCAPSSDASALREDGHAGCPVGQTKYNKPWLNTMFMFIGEASLLLAYGVSSRHTVRVVQPDVSSERHLPLAVELGLPADAAPRTVPLYMFAIPALCDVFGTGLATVGMQYMDSAIWQMLRSSIIIFSALLSVTFLRRRLQPFQWLATFIVFLGLLLVGYASLLDARAASGGSPSSASSQQLFGMALVVGAQLVSAFQMVFEEMLLTGRAKTSAQKVVGMEGVWGGFFMLIILVLMSTLPGNDGGHIESAPHGMHMVVNSPTLLALVPTYMVSIALYNFVGITVGQRMSAVVRCLVDSCRTFVVWAVDLLLYYAVSKEFGSAWLPHSWITVIGFCILVLGTCLYNEVVPVPSCLVRRPVAVGDNGDGDARGGGYRDAVAGPGGAHGKASGDQELVITSSP